MAGGALGLPGPASLLLVVPLPVEARVVDGSPFQLAARTIIVCDGDAELQEVAARAVEALRRVTGWTLRTGAAAGGGSNLVLRLERGLFSGLPEWQRAESYRLSVNGSRIELAATAAHGLFNGAQTLSQLVAPAGEGQWQVGACEVEDYPRFQWRGLLLDPARHFLPPDYLKKFIEVMAFYKYNRLQFHLTDDQGWRLEIKKYPLLTEIGSIRKESPKRGHREQGDGQVYGPFYYTQDQIRELVAYAKARQVTLAGDRDSGTFRGGRGGPPGIHLRRRPL